MSHDPYLIPGTGILRNRLDIRNAVELDSAERYIVAQAASEGVPQGNFDVQHLQAIHRHLFSDVYDWAGELRTVEISKGGSAFQPTRYLDAGMADIHRRLEKDNFLRGLDADTFANKAGEIMGDLNHAHPFREGNGRTQLQYLKQLAEQAGHPINLRKLEPEQWIEASIQANVGNYGPMQAAISGALHERQRDQNNELSR